MPMLLFGKDLDLRLIKLVEINPILYDSSYQEYGDPVKREQIWQDIGKLLSRSSRDCKTRWINIRDNMRRTRQKALAAGKTNMKYKYEEPLKFLVPFFKSSLPPIDSAAAESNDNCASGSGIDTEKYETVSEFEEPAKDYEIEDSKSGISSLMMMSDETFSSDTHAVENTTETNACKCMSSSEQKIPSDPLDCFTHAVENTTETNACKCMSSNEQKKPSDPLDYFLETVGITLRGLNPYYLNLAKSKIFQVVQDCELQQIINKGEVPKTF